jgi:hypothetical protein
MPERMGCANSSGTRTGGEGDPRPPAVRRRGGRRGGFTLVELAIAAVLLTVAILGALQAGVATHDLVVTTEETRTALSDLEAAMEQVLLLPLSAIPIASSEFAEGEPVAAFERLHLREESIVADYPGYDGGDVPDPLEIVLTVSWTDFAGRPRSLSMRTMRTK